jgi:hypothetical protein
MLPRIYLLVLFGRATWPILHLFLPPLIGAHLPVRAKCGVSRLGSQIFLVGIVPTIFLKTNRMEEFEAADAIQVRSAHGISKDV